MRRPTSTPTSGTTRCSSRRRTTITSSSSSRRSGPALQTGLRVATRHGWEWPDFLEYSIGPHREVFEAVIAHDAERAGQAMERLVTQSQLSLEHPSGPDVAPSRPFTRA